PGHPWAAKRPALYRNPLFCGHFEGASDAGDRFLNATSLDGYRPDYRDITRLTPSTTHGGHPASPGAPVATTMATSVRCSRSISSSSLAIRCSRWARGHGVFAIRFGPSSPSLHELTSVCLSD